MTSVNKRKIWIAGAKQKGPFRGCREMDMRRERAAEGVWRKFEAKTDMLSGGLSLNFCCVE